MSFAEIAALTLHDVKNRLAQLAARAESRGDVETLREAHAAAGSLTRLLAYYRADIGSLRPEIDARSPADLVAELAADDLLHGGREIRTDVASAPTLWFYDETLVRMVLADAVQNAVRHARSGITISAGQDGGMLRFDVADDGPGYPDAVMNDDTGDAASVSREGTGLGIRLARRVARLHENKGRQGRVALGNKAGAVFSLFLP